MAFEGAIQKHCTSVPDFLPMIHTRRSGEIDTMVLTDNIFLTQQIMDLDAVERTTRGDLRRYTSDACRKTTS